VAEGASHGGVRVGQRETGGGVIEDACSPCGDGVAGGAGSRGGGESSRNVVGNVAANRCGALKGCRMATVAIGGAERVVVAHMAQLAGSRLGRHVRSRQSKSGRAVIECCGSKAHGCVAIGAISRGKQRSSRGVRRSRGALPAAAIVGVQVAAGIPAIGGGNR